MFEGNIIDGISFMAGREAIVFSLMIIMECGKEEEEI